MEHVPYTLVVHRTMLRTTDFTNAEDIRENIYNYESCLSPLMFCGSYQKTAWQFHKNKK